MNILLCLKRLLLPRKNNTMQIDEIRQKLSVIKAQGYIKSRRSGPTGVGHTLEELLGIKENNIASPDFGEIELKTQRENSANLITLFTFNKKAWVMNSLEAIRKYGSLDENGRQGMYYTMGLKPNSAGLFLYIDKKTISVRHVDGNDIAVWQLEEIQKKFMEKVKNVLLVKAKVEVIDGAEHFLYDRARLLSGGTTVKILKSQFESETIVVDLRLHDKGTSARNHGTAFRIYEKNIESFYNSVTEIDI